MLAHPGPSTAAASSQDLGPAGGVGGVNVEHGSPRCKTINGAFTYLESSSLEWYSHGDTQATARTFKRRRLRDLRRSELRPAFWPGGQGSLESGQMWYVPLSLRCEWWLAACGRGVLAGEQGRRDLGREGSPTAAKLGHHGNGDCGGAGVMGDATQAAMLGLYSEGDGFDGEHQLMARLWRTNRPWLAPG